MTSSKIDEPYMHRRQPGADVADARPSPATLHLRDLGSPVPRAAVARTPTEQAGDADVRYKAERTAPAFDDIVDSTAVRRHPGEPSRAVTRSIEVRLPELEVEPDLERASWK
uniref:Uncharacterized protein n=1 Tax=Streptomyces sp. NBC_00119 TaxID=2975659 RepID=A0AAU1UMM8_9ACTN